MVEMAGLEPAKCPVPQTGGLAAGPHLDETLSRVSGRHLETIVGTDPLQTAKQQVEMGVGVEPTSAGFAVPGLAV